jgi:anti-sigma regulatory factor (Ser/Thr protein kinase)
MTQLEVELDLPCGVNATAAARAAVCEALLGWGFRDAELVQLSQLVVTELVTNAVRHARGTPRLLISADRHTVMLAVDDPSPAPPQRTAPTDGGGRGLFIVETVAAAWGYYEHPGDGKRVWARLAAPNGPEDPAREP